LAEFLDVTHWRPRPWDSAFFGLAVAEIVPDAMTCEGLATAVADARNAAIDCLYLLVDADSQPAIRAAEANGFSLVDLRLTLQCRADAPRPPVPATNGIRPARPEDVPRLKDLARTSHRNTRFYRDGRFDARRSDELYAVWIESSVTGELADAVWVVDVDGAPRGYLTASRRGAASSIGLVAVDAEYRGRGFGDGLLSTVRDWTIAEGRAEVTVVTQGRNPAAVRFYERAGFCTNQVELWYHRWF
jgi:dTDP-4-amino-4,6-dideoxy-D-galactose acyltransferase